MSHHRNFPERALIVVFALALSAAAAEGQRAPTAGPTSAIRALPTAPTVTVAQDGGVLTWISTGATDYKVERALPGKGWSEIATVPGNATQYVDNGATKLVPCNGTMHYRVTARYADPGRSGSYTTAVSPAVAWQRPMPMPVSNLTANSPAKGEVNLSWTGAAVVHVFVRYDQVTPAMMPFYGFSTGLQNQPSSANESDRAWYYVAAACEVTGQGWVIAPVELSKHPHVYVVVK